MIELIRTNDVVLISFLRSLFEDSEIVYLVADEHMSVLEGMIGVLPRRVLVREDHAARARRLIADAGLEKHLKEPTTP